MNTNSEDRFNSSETNDMDNNNDTSVCANAFRVRKHLCSYDSEADSESTKSSSYESPGKKLCKFIDVPYSIMEPEPNNESNCDEESATYSIFEEDRPGYPESYDSSTETKEVEEVFMVEDKISAVQEARLNAIDKMWEKDHEKMTWVELFGDGRNKRASKVESLSWFAMQTVPGPVNKARTRTVIKKWSKEQTKDENRLLSEVLDSDKDPKEVVAQLGSNYVMRTSLHTLKGKNWLNDEVMNYMYDMIVRKYNSYHVDCMRRVDAWCKAYSSYFWTKIAQEDNKKRSLRGVYSYRQVHTWGRKKCIGKHTLGIVCDVCL